MKERYSLAECQRLLGGIDFKTLKLWMSKAGIVASAGKDDNRVKYISGTELHQLADEHERAIPTNEPTQEEKYNLLIDRVNGLYDVVGKQQKELADLWRELAARSPVSVPSLPQQGSNIMTAITDLRRTIEQLEKDQARDIANLHNRLDSLPGQQIGVQGITPDELKKFRGEMEGIREQYSEFGKRYGRIINEMGRLERRLKALEQPPELSPTRKRK